MIFNNIDEIVALIKKPKNAEFIKHGYEIHEVHELHVTGDGIDEWVEKIVGIENDKALKLRKQLTLPFTVPILSNVLKPFDKVNSSKGTVRKYDFTDTDAELNFRTILSNEQLKDFISQRWLSLLNLDPSGIIFMEISTDGKRCYPCYKSIDCLLDIDFKHQTSIEYIIFKGENEILSNGTRQVSYRVIDEKFDYTIVQINDQFYIDEQRTIPINPIFGKIPAMFISNKIDKENGQNFDSYISECLIFAEQYLRRASNLETYIVKQCNPVVWENKTDCPKCGGVGTDKHGETCSLCNGSGIGNGTRDVADKLIIDPSMSEKDEKPVAGYIQPDLKTWEQSEISLEKIENKIYNSIWGSDSNQVNKQKQNQSTAFEIATKSKGQDDKLNGVSTCADIIETEITNYLGKFYYPTLYRGCEIHRSRRYNTQPAEELFATYINAKINGVNSTILDAIYENYLHNLYDKNENELQRNLIKLWTKPFFHLSVTELNTLRVNNNDYLKNLYYDEFIADYENNVKPLYLATIDEINMALDGYIKQVPVSNMPTGTM